MHLGHLLRLALAALLFASPALAGRRPYLTAAQVDLLHLLPPPPHTGSAQDQADKADAVKFEQERQPERVAQARADADKSVFAKFGPVMGPRFKPEALPLATKLFERLTDTEEVVVAPSKDGFGRLRPFLANPALHPAVSAPTSGSYPSGHATGAAIMAVVLGDMTPELREVIFARASDYAESRVIAGEHYPSDILAGREAGIAIAAVLANDPAFQADFGPARAEVRAALGMTP
jgi:acid phosphatase (class A)